MAFFFLHFFLIAYADLLRAASAMDEEPRLVLALAVRKVRCVEESILATFNASGCVCSPRSTQATLFVSSYYCVY